MEKQTIEINNQNVLRVATDSVFGYLANWK